MKNISVVRGIVVASKWNEDGSVSGISIQGYDQKEYIVQLNECGRKLFHALQKLLCVTGRVSRTNDGRNTINIKHFEVTELNGEFPVNPC